METMVVNSKIIYYETATNVKRKNEMIRIFADTNLHIIFNRTVQKVFLAATLTTKASLHKLS